jgi:hypothetical protein
MLDFISGASQSISRSSDISLVASGSFIISESIFTTSTSGNEFTSSLLSIFAFAV